MLFTLTRRTTVAPGEWVLVLGAGGGIGLAAVDVATALGARVIAAASTPDKLEAAVAIGAEATIAYEGEDLKTRARELSGGGVDVVVDPVGGRHAEPALRATRHLGRFCVIGFASGPIPSIPLNQVLLNNRTARRRRLGRLDVQGPVRQPGARRRAHGHGCRGSPAPDRSLDPAARRGGRRHGGPDRQVRGRQGRPRPLRPSTNPGPTAGPTAGPRRSDPCPPAGVSRRTPRREPRRARALPPG